ncbi:MAG: hypothetical protein H6708_19210 [Kofleriaceae bacterium]|nr:hypothetical protein [Kofleriaceae bacterium]
MLPLSVGAQNLSLARLPIAVVVAAVMGGDLLWQAVGDLRRTRTVVAAVLATLGLGSLLVGVGVGALTIVLIGVAPLARALAHELLHREVRAPGHDVRAISLLTAAVVLQVVGLWRGETFGDVPRSATLALGAQVVLALIIIALQIIATAGHRAVTQRAGAATLAVIAVASSLGGGLGPVVAVAVALVWAALVVEPVMVRRGREPRP